MLPKLKFYFSGIAKTAFTVQSYTFVLKFNDIYFQVNKYWMEAFIKKKIQSLLFLNALRIHEEELCCIRPKAHPV